MVQNCPKRNCKAKYWKIFPEITIGVFFKWYFNDSSDWEKSLRDLGGTKTDQKFYTTWHPDKMLIRYLFLPPRA